MKDRSPAASMEHFGQFDGRRKDIFRAVSRWSPRDETVHDLGRFFFEFADQPLAQIEIY